MKPSFLADNRFSSPTASGSATGYPPANVADRRPYTVWYGAGTSPYTLTASTPGQGDTLALAGHNLGSLGASVSLEVSDDGVDFTTLDTFSPSSDLAIMRPFTLTTSSHWRVSITAAAAPYIGVLMVGKSIRPARFPSGKFKPEIISVNKETARSKAGHLLGATVRSFPKDVTVTLQYPGNAWVEDDFLPFFVENAGKPFFFGWDLEDWPDKCGLYAFSDGFRYEPTYDELDRISSLPLKLSGTRS